MSTACGNFASGSGVRFQEHEHLLRCQTVLRTWGFEALEVLGPGGRRFLEVEAGPA
ncbi:hypothetical protein ACWC9R_11770 [Streptomyces sp. NPDC001219]